MTFIICSAQMSSAWEDPHASLAKAGSCVQKAAENGASIICFPEQFATGWDPRSHRHIQDANGEIVRSLSELARRHHIGIVGSFREQGRPSPKNTSVVIDQDGQIIGRYAKIHLFSPGREDTAYSPGNTLSLFSLGSLTFGLAICYDLRFPGLFRAYRDAGADVVIVTAAWPCSRQDHWNLFVRARALENQYFVAGVNCTGSTPVGRYCGGSLVAGPGGEILARGGEDEEMILAAIDHTLILNARSDMPIHSDCREDIYKLTKNNKY